MERQADQDPRLPTSSLGAMAKEKRRVLGIAVVAAVVGLAVVFVLWGQLLVFAIGAAITILLVPVVDRLERHGWPRPLAAVATVVTTLAATLATLVGISYVLLDQGVRYIGDLPSVVTDLRAWYQAAELPAWLHGALDEHVLSLETELAAIDQDALVAEVASGAVDFAAGMLVWLLLPFFLFYLLKDQPRMVASFWAGVPRRWEADVRRVLSVTLGSFARYLKAELIVGAIMFAVVTSGMLAIGIVLDAPALIRFALLLGLIAFVLELVPQIGPILSCIPALLLALPAGIGVAIVVAVFYFIAFNIEGSVLVPTFQGRLNHFSGASVLVIVSVGFATAGILGAILALPLASIVRDLVVLVADDEGEPVAAADAALIAEAAVIAPSTDGRAAEAA